MTLNTHVVAVTPCDAHDLFNWCRDWLGCDERHLFEDEPAKYHGDGAWQILNKPNQGLAGWLWLYYRPNLEPLRTPEQSAEHDEDCEPDCTGFPNVWHDPACWVDATLDTAYGYRGENGETCSQLHARWIFDMGQWFEERKIQWGWKNEFTGDWHFEDKYKALEEFIGNGGQAMAWFTETVQPVIEAEFPGVVWS